MRSQFYLVVAALSLFALSFVAAADRDELEKIDQKANELVDQKQLEKAITLFQNLLELSQKNSQPEYEARAHRGLVRILIRQDKLDEAEKELELVQQLQPGLSGLITLRGILWNLQGKTEEAERQLKLGILKEPEWRTKAWFSLAILQEKRNELEKALVNYKRILNLKPNDTDTLLFAASLCFRLKEYKQGIEFAKNASPTATGDLQKFLVSYWLGMNHQRAGQYELAEKPLEEAVSLAQTLSPPRPDYHYQALVELVSLLLTRKKYDESDVYFNQLSNMKLETSGTISQATIDALKEKRIEAERLRERQKQNEMLVDPFIAYIQGKPLAEVSLNDLFKAAEFQMQQKNESIAASYLFIAVQKEPTEATILKYVDAVTLVDVNSITPQQLSDLEFVRKAKDKLPPSATLERKLGALFCDVNLKEEGSKMLQKAIELNPNYENYITYGRALKNKEEYEKAILSFEKAMEYGPTNVDDLQDLAWLLQKVDQYERSLAPIQQAQTLPNPSAYQIERGFALTSFAYEKMGRLREAEEMVNKSMTPQMDLYRKAILYGALIGLLQKRGEHQKVLSSAELILGFDKKILNDSIRRVGNSLIAITQLDAGESLRELGRYEEALKFFNQALEEIGRLPAGSARALQWRVAYEQLALLHENKGEYEQALGWFEEELDLAEGSTKMWVDSRRISMLRNLGRFEEADLLLNDFKFELENMKDEETKNASLSSASTLYSNFGDYEKALEINLLRLKNAKRKGRLSAIADCLMDVGDNFVDLGRFEEALVYFEEAVTILEKMPSLVDLAYAKGRIASCYNNMGDLQRSRQYDTDALRSYEEIGRKKSVASSMENLAFIDKTLGNFESALKLFDKARNIYTSLGHKFDAARIHGYIAGLWEDQGNYKNALQEETRAYDLKIQGGAVLSSAWNLVDIARYQIHLKMPTAESNLKEAMSIYEKAKSAGGMTFTKQTMADLKLAEKKFTEAEKLLSQVTLEDEKSGYVLNWEAWYSLGLAEKELQKREEALSAFRKSIGIIEKLRNSVPVENEGERLFLNKYRKVYDGLIELLLAPDSPSRNEILEAHYQIDRLKIAEAQENSLGVISSNEDPQKQAAMRKIQSLRFSEVDIEKRIREEGSKRPPDEKRLEHLRELQRANRQESSQYTATLREQYPDLFQDQEVKPEQLEALMEDLPPEVMILVPTLLEEKKKIAILGYTQAAPFYRETDLISKEDFYEKLNDFRNLLITSRSSEENIKQAGQELYDLLIEPVEYLFSGMKLLIVSPSGRLRNIPFQALHDGKQYLVEKMPIVNLAYLKISPPHYAADMKLFAIANPNNNLSGADEQVNKLKELFPNTMIKRHAEATQSALKWPEGENKYSILIFASHAELNDIDPRESYIELAGEDQLRYAAISGFKTYWKNVDLVVLSACKTAQQPLSTEKSAAHNIAFEFDKSGVHSTIATLWQVVDPSTADLFTSFFHAVKKKESMGRALQMAQMDLMRSEKYSHPFYWAPFIFIGDWR